MSEKRKLLIWLIILAITVFVLRGSPQDKTYIILADSQHYIETADSETEEVTLNGKKYIAVKEEANEEQIENTVVVIIIIVMLLFIFGSSDTAQTGG